MSPSPGPTFTMPARKVRAGDVLFLPAELDEPRAVLAAHWETPLDVTLVLEGGAVLTVPLDTQLDVTRPFARHAETGDHDT